MTTQTTKRLINWIQDKSNSDTYKLFWQSEDEVSVTYEDKPTVIYETLPEVEFEINIFDIETTCPIDTEEFIAPHDERFDTEDVWVGMICLETRTKNGTEYRAWVGEDFVFNRKSWKVLSFEIYSCANPCADFLSFIEQRARRIPMVLIGFNSSSQYVPSDQHKTAPSNSYNLLRVGYDFPAVIRSAKRNIRKEQDNRTCNEVKAPNKAVFRVTNSWKHIMLLDVNVCIVKYVDQESYIEQKKLSGSLEGWAHYFKVEGKKELGTHSDKIKRITLALTGQIEGNEVLEYCFQDVRVTGAIFDKCKGMSRIYATRKAMNYSPLLATYGIVPQANFRIEEEMYKRQKKNAPMNHYQFVPIMKTVPYKGGLTHVFGDGMYKIYALLDYASLYANVMLEYNICTTTYIGNSEDGITVENVPYKTIKNVINGVDFYYRTDFLGIIPRCIQISLGARDSLKEIIKILKKKKELNEEQLNILKTLDIDLDNPDIEFLEAIQLVYKVQSNGFYGATGNEYMKYFCSAIAASITTAARNAEMVLSDALSASGLKTTYGSTDSAFCIPIDPSKPCLGETYYKQEINKYLAERFTYLRVDGELESEQPVSLYLTGQLRGYATQKKGKLSVSAFKTTQYSPKCKELFSQMMKELLDAGEIVEGPIDRFSREFVDAFNRGEIFMNMKVLKKSLLKGKILNLNHDRPFYAYLPFFPTGKNQNKCYYNLNLDSSGKHFDIDSVEWSKDPVLAERQRDMAMETIFMSLFTWFGCKAFSKAPKNYNFRHMFHGITPKEIYEMLKLPAANKDKKETKFYPHPNATESFNDFFQEQEVSNLFYVYKNIYADSGFVIVLYDDMQHDDPLVFYNEYRMKCLRILEDASVMIVAIRTGWQGDGTYLVGVDFDEDTDLTKSLWPTDTFGCWSKEKRHMFYRIKPEPNGQVYLINPVVNKIGKEGVTGYFELKQEGAMLEYSGKHRYKDHYYEPIDLPILELTGKQFAKRILNFNNSDTNKMEFDVIRLQPLEVRHIKSCEHYELPPEIVERTKGIVEEQAPLLETITKEQWGDKQGFVYPIMAAYSNILNQEELTEQINVIESLKAFQECKNLRKLDEFRTKREFSWEMVKPTLRKHNLYTSLVANRIKLVKREKHNVVSMKVEAETLQPEHLYPEPGFFLTAVRAPWANGKTKALIKFISESDLDSVLFVLPTNRLEQKKKLERDLAAQGIVVSSFSEQCFIRENHQVIVAQFESLHKVVPHLVENEKEIVLIIDEVMSLTHQIISTPNKASQSENIATLTDLRKQASRVIICDASLDEPCMMYYSDKKPVKRVICTKSHMQYKITAFEDSFGGYNDILDELLDDYKNEFPVAVVCDDRSELLMIQEQMQKIRPVDESFIMVCRGHPVPEYVDWENVRTLLWNGTWQHTVSIENSPIERVYGIFKSSLMLPTDRTNMLHRVRTMKELKLYQKTINRKTSTKDIDDYKKIYYRFVGQYKPAGFTRQYYGNRDDGVNVVAIQEASSVWGLIQGWKERPISVAIFHEDLKPCCTEFTMRKSTEQKQQKDEYRIKEEHRDSTWKPMSQRLTAIGSDLSDLVLDSKLGKISEVMKEMKILPNGLHSLKPGQDRVEVPIARFDEMLSKIYSVDPYSFKSLDGDKKYNAMSNLLSKSGDYKVQYNRQGKYGKANERKNPIHSATIIKVFYALERQVNHDPPERVVEHSESVVPLVSVENEVTLDEIIAARRLI